jgi:uncharacterized protein YecE (DUF72 family)
MNNSVSGIFRPRRGSGYMTCLSDVLLVHQSMTIHIGTSGWSYSHWQGVLYPSAIDPRQRLGLYTQHFRTVEVNSSYYHWPRDKAFARWASILPEGFVMTTKAPRGLTHSSRLYAPEKWLARITHGLDYLRSKRGVLLVQLPPGFAYDYARLEYFLSLLPAHQKVALEFRHPSWHREEVFRLLEDVGAAYCIMSGANLPCILRATASFVYVRLHGPSHQHLYAGSYSHADLHWWANRIKEWHMIGKEVFVYFNNDGEGNAVRNAATLNTILATEGLTAPAFTH